MAQPRVSAGGGFAALFYSWRMGRQAGGIWKLYKRLRAKNACKTCALGMGGQQGGMVNEVGHFPEVCKKSLQAQAADMIAPLPDDFFAKNSIELLGSMTPRQLEYAGRLSYPIIAEEGDSHYRRISWEEALKSAGAAFKGLPPSETFFYASGRSSNEAAFLLQLIARAYGTNNVHNCSYYCHSASGVALAKVYGSGTASVVLDDLKSADFVLIAGANPASNHPRLLTQLMELRRRGGRVVVINPLKELGLVRFRVPSDWRSMIFGTQIADHYVQPHVGGDVALFQGILKALLERKGVHDEFIAKCTEGWDAVSEDVRALDWSDLVASCGVAKQEIERVAEMIFAAERGIFCWAMGLTHHAHGVDNILALCNIALAKGWLGRKGCGLMPIRG
ncbi:MAG: molybdopterin-dependent oxidoreductase, partial [Myxococcota bacterium]|nr:molybdopterin-dependent oxidoreductase [Myxococcota bacterium]